MFKFEKTMEIRILHHQGLSNRAIAMKLRVSRNTVRKYLQQNGDGSLVYGPRKGVGSKLDAYRGYLQERLTKAAPHKIPSTVLLQEIRELGYEGSLSLLRCWVRRIKPLPQQAPLVRFETKPGVQLQVDWVLMR